MSGATPARRFWLLSGVVLFLWLASSPASAAREDTPGDLPAEGHFVYAPVPDVSLTGINGAEVVLSDLWKRRPLIVTMVFAGCYEICPFYLRSLAAAVDDVGGAGERFDVVVVSFDPRDTPESMHAMAERHALASQAGWSFTVTSPAEAKRLADAIGFWFEPSAAAAAAAAGSFDHPAMLAAIDGGLVVRLLVGATVTTRRLREVIWELERVVVPTYPLPSEKVVFRCFGFDPGTGSLVLDWGLLLLLTPGAAMFLSAVIIFRPRSRQLPPHGVA